MAFDRLLQGKAVLVTGGSRGLGRAIALECARQGARVAFNYSSDESGAEETLQALQALGVEGRAERCSVTDAPAFEAMVRRVEKEFAPIDVLVSNAGISQPLPLALMDDSDWAQVMGVNATGAFLASRTVLRGMVRRRSGAVLHIGSLAGARLIEAPVHYCASKAAVHAMTRALAKEMGRYGIRINCLAPGLLEDGVGRSLPEHRLHDYLEHVALGRLGRFDEVARFAAFLVSERNSYMNGEVIVMDGAL